MRLKSLNQLRAFRAFLMRLWLWRQTADGRVRFGRDVRLSLSTRLRSDIPDGITVGDETLIAFKVLAFTRCALSGEQKKIRIGSRCFIGGGSILAPGVSIGDHCIVGAGSVVLNDVPSGSIVGGNPARILRSGVSLEAHGVLPLASENTRRLWKI